MWLNVPIAVNHQELVLRVRRGRIDRAETARIHPVKLHGYLLSTAHPIGRFKARFFGALGFVAERWPELDTALRAQHLICEADVPAFGLRRGDLGTVVEVCGSDAIVVEFVAASGRTQALVTLKPSDIRAVSDDDLVSVRPSSAIAS